MTALFPTEVPAVHHRTGRHTPTTAHDLSVYLGELSPFDRYVLRREYRWMRIDGRSALRSRGTVHRLVRYFRTGL